MKFNDNFLIRYLAVAPLALSIERVQECRILSELPFERPILDMGCGDGVFADILFKDSIDAGIDADQTEIDNAARGGMYKELITCKGNDVPKDQGAFQTVFSNSVLEHIADLGPTLREVHRLLAPGGHFYVTVPTDRFERCSAPSRLLEGVGLTRLAGRYRSFYNRFWKHYNIHDAAGWSRVFEEAGFQVSASRLYHPQNLCTLCDLLVLFALPSFVSKKVLGRWMLIPAFRRLYARLLGAAAAPLVARLEQQGGGGLVFFDLVRP